MKAKRTAFLGICVALSMILSYLESLLPPMVAVPGIKVGIANLVTIFMLYKVRASQTVAVSIIRVVLVSMLFGTGLSLLYSLVGAAFSLCGMILLKKSGLFSAVTVSVVGGVLHNIGQIVTAAIIMETSQLLFYLPILLISGTLAGIAVGLTASLIGKRLENWEL